jgi:hypothetical protein
MRSGRFKKQMLSPQMLQERAGVASDFLAKLKNIWQQQLISDAEFTGIYLMYFAWLKSPYKWVLAQQRLPLDRQSHITMNPACLEIFPEVMLKPLRETGSVREFFQQYRLRGVPENARVVMQKWLAGEWSLRALTDEADVGEMLLAQAEGVRLVTLFIDPVTLVQGTAHERDVFSFALHDLMHAYEFFYLPASRDSQKGMYRLLCQSHREGVFNDVLSSPMKESLEYIFSDLNAYAIHMLRALKGVVRKYFELMGRSSSSSSSGEFQAWMHTLFVSWGMNAHLSQLATQMSFEKPLSREDETVLLDFFIERGRSKVYNRSS